MNKYYTEPPFSGDLLDEKRDGIFKCASCGNPLFLSGSKFNSGTGWPSFDQALPQSVKYVEDNSSGMNRTEVMCAKCGAHLGHVFRDGPKETTGKRYCVNSVSLEFEGKRNKGDIE